MKKRTTCGALALLALLPAITGSAQPVANYTPVTDARLTAPEDRNWLMYLRTYNSWSYSPLARITPRNVARLVPVWTMSTGATEGHQSPPIVNDGVMFITTPFNQVFALDAKTGDLLWRYRHQMPADIRMGHPTNRGVALYGDKVYTATSDAKVIAFDAKTGEVVWEKAVEDYNGGYYMTLAPLAARGKSDGWRVWRGARHSRIRCRTRRADGRAGLEDLHRARARRARQRHVARRIVAHRRRARVDHRQLRSRAWPHLLGHRQSRTVDRRSATRRQFVYEFGRRTRRGQRRAQGAPPVPLERLLGLGRGRGTVADRRTARRPHRARARARGSQWLSVAARAQCRSHFVHRCETVRAAERVHEH